MWSITIPVYATFETSFGGAIMLAKGLDIKGHIVGTLPMPLWLKPKYGVYGLTWRNIEFGKPTRFCYMTFLVKGIEIGGINDFLQGDYGSVKG